MKKERFDYILKAKARQLTDVRQRCEALELTNRILSAYLVCLVLKSEDARVPKAAVRRALDGCVVRLISDGDDYVLSVLGAGDEETGSEQI